MSEEFEIETEENEEQGASLVEYALLVALIAVVCIVSISLLGNAASEKFKLVTDTLNQSGT